MQVRQKEGCLISLGGFIGLGAIQSYRCSEEGLVESRKELKVFVSAPAFQV